MVSFQGCREWGFAFFCLWNFPHLHRKMLLPIAAAINKASIDMGLMIRAVPVSNTKPGLLGLNRGVLFP